MGFEPVLAGADFDDNGDFEVDGGTHFVFDEGGLTNPKH